MKCNKKIDAFFKKLYNACRYHNDAYGVHEICQYFGIPYEQVKLWTQENKRYADILELCHMSCYVNVEKAWIFVRMPEDKARAYMDQHNRLYDFEDFGSG